MRNSLPRASKSLLVILGLLLTPLILPPLSRLQGAPDGDSPALVQVERVAVEHDIQWRGEGAMKVGADLRVRGGKGQKLTVEITFHDRGGRPIPAGSGAPKSYSDARGNFLATVTKNVPDDDWSWRTLQYAVPYSVLGVETRRPNGVAVQVKITCAGLIACADADVTAADGRPSRAVRVVGIDVKADAGLGAGVIVLPGSRTPPSPDVGRVGDDPRQPTPALETDAPTRFVTCRLEADGCEGQELITVLNLCGPDGSVVSATEDAPAANVGPGGVFCVIHRSARLEGNRARTTTPRLVLPLRYARLPPGESGDLILAVSGLCSGLKAVMQQRLSRQAPPSDPTDRMDDESTVITVAELLVRALREANGDRIRGLCTAALARQLTELPAIGARGSTDVTHHVHSVSVKGDSAHVVVRMQNPRLEGKVLAEIRLAIWLQREPEAWKVAALRVRPFLPELDDPENDR